VPMALVESFYPGLYDRFLFVSEVTEKKVLERILRPVRFSTVIPNGINEDLLKKDPLDGSAILFFSRLDVYQKGIDVLLAAFAKIGRRHPEATLILAGYEFDKFDRIISGVPPGLRERIVYAGFVTGEEKASLLSQARLFVLPSRYESLPISIFEAAASGKAVLVSDIAEMAFVEREGFGLSFPSGSVDGLAEKMDILMKDKALRDRLGRRGREFARDYLWDTIALRFEEALEQVVKGR